jgi:DNA processing protein
VETLLPWFHLKSVPGIGSLLFKRLILRFGSPQAVLAAAPEELAAVEGMGPRLAAAVKARRPPPEAAAEIEAAFAAGCRIVTLGDPDYPALLREIPDPPAWLYVRGELPGAAPAVAVVGCRNPTRYGLEIARQLAADLAGRGIAVVSGMALGIDAAAHEGALGAGGRTVAVLGSGLNNVYPRQHERLCERIAAGGAVMTEFPLAAGPEPHHFPMRNRIISGIAGGTVVVEASLTSGALITARMALEQNREVFAVPGSVRSFQSRGPHALIKQGAKLVENAGDVVEELAQFIAAAAPPSPPPTAGAPAAAPSAGLSPEEARVLRELGPYPEHIDALVRRLGTDAGRLAGILLQLELKGLAAQHPGKMFSASSPAVS